MADRLPVVLRTDTTPARLQEMPAADLLPKSVLTNALGRPDHTGPLNWAWATYGGTANAVTLAPAFARTAYAAGDQLRFRATATNTGATTINVGGLGAKTAVTVTGAALPAGYIRTDADTVCVYDGMQFVVQREVERGVNANGVYLKFAEGRQFCETSAAPVLINSYNIGFTWTYPAVFSATPWVSGNLIGTLATTKNLSVQGYAASSIAATVSALSIGQFIAGDVTGLTMQAMAIGWWY